MAIEVYNAGAPIHWHDSPARKARLQHIYKTWNKWILESKSISEINIAEGDRYGIGLTAQDLAESSEEAINRAFESNPYNEGFALMHRLYQFQSWAANNDFPVRMALSIRRSESKRTSMYNRKVTARIIVYSLASETEAVWRLSQ